MAKRFIGEKRLRPESLMMSYGYRPEWSEGAIKCPIFQTSTFVFRSAEEGKTHFDVALGRKQVSGEGQGGLIYSRLNNPDDEILEDRLRLWDDAEACAVFSSGMAAIATTLLQSLQPGDVLLHSEPVYGGTDYFIKHVLPKFGIETVGFAAGEANGRIEKAYTNARIKGRLGMVFVETPSNPTNQLVDIAECAAVAQKYSTEERKVPLAVDNTFLGPVWQHPIKHGADVVLYSATKYIGGHSDVIAGVALGSREFIDPIRTLRTFMGTVCSPWTGWLLLRSLETLKLRMTAQMKTARYVADFLANHPKVDRVYYLGHLNEDDPQFSVYRKQCLGPGGMISFDIRGGEKDAFRFLDSLKLFQLAVSLGGTESLASHPASTTHSEIDPEELTALNVSEKMVRLSIGVEHPEDLIADLDQALESV